MHHTPWQFRLFLSPFFFYLFFAHSLPVCIHNTVQHHLSFIFNKYMHIAKHPFSTQVKFPIRAFFHSPSYTFKNNILDWVNLPFLFQPVHVFIITLITFLAIVTITNSHSLRVTKGYKTIQRESLPLICCNPPICNHVFIVLVLWFQRLESQR